MRPLDICLVTTFYPPWSFGGDAVYVERLARSLVDEGHRVTVVHCVDSFRILSENPEPVESQPDDGVEVISLRHRVAQLSPAITYLSGRPGLKRRPLRTLLEGRRFDVTHFHNISLFGPDVLRLGRGARLLSLHEHWLVCPMHVLWKDNRELCVEPSCFTCSLHFRRPPQLWRATGLLGRSLESVDAVLAPTRFVLDEHARRGLKLEHGLVLPYFVDDPGGADSARSPNRFAYIGRLEPIKGVVPLVEAFRDAPELELVIAGDGTQRDEVRSLAARIPNVTAIGRVDAAGVARLLATATALVIPSVGYEAGPVVAIEAFSHGAPIVGRRLGGIAETLASAGSPTFERDDEIVGMLRRLAADPAALRAIGARGRAQFEARHTPRAHLDAYYEIIERAERDRASRVVTARARPRPRASSSSGG